MKKKRVLIVSAEFASLTNLGVLGERVEILANSLGLFNNEVAVCLPFYKELKVDTSKLEKIALPNIKIQGYNIEFFSFKLNKITIYLVSNGYFFTSRNSVYGYDDDNYRFSLFSLAVINLLNYIERPDIIHLNDWHTALISVLVKVRNIDIKTVLSIHSLDYQGISDIDILNFLRIDKKYFYSIGIDFSQKINFLKLGILYSDLIVLNTKKELELLTESHHLIGLENLLKEVLSKVVGISLGIDRNYNPEKDGLISSNYSTQNLLGKLKCKNKLQEELNLPINTEIPIIVIPSIFITEYETRLLNSIIPYITKMEMQIILLGNKLADFEKNIRDYALRKNYNVVSIEYTDQNIRKVFSASDIFLDISLNISNVELIKKALKYGVIPIIFKETKDLEIEDTKFRLFNFSTEDLINTIKYTINKYYYLEKWNQQVKMAMSYDFSYENAVAEYDNQYNLLFQNDFSYLGH